MELFGKCPYVTAQKLVSGKWAILILYHLDGQTKRFNQLQRDLGEITQSTLTKQLRYLEEEGLVVRKVYPEVPPRVEYSLTPVGREFHMVLEQIEIWGKKYIANLEKE